MGEVLEKAAVELQFAFPQRFISSLCSKIGSTSDAGAQLALHQLYAVRAVQHDLKTVKVAEGNMVMTGIQ